MNRFIRRWKSPGGYKEVLTMAFPLILSTSAWSVQNFIDRMYLAWYSAESVAAALPAGVLNFAFSCFFIGIASYVNTFVAQYYGANNHKRIGSVIWQGIYFSVISMFFIWACIPLAKPIFELAGHSIEIQRQEVEYFTIMCMGGFFPVSASVLSSFFSGIGKTNVVMWVTFASTLTNIVLDYCMIFGNWGFPEMGIAGAAYATLIAGAVSTVLFFILILKKKYQLAFGILEGWKFDKTLFLRLLKFGVPNGVQFFLDLMGFSIFILLVGKYGTIELAATNISFNINTLAFLPMLGLGTAVSVIVGQRLGENDPEKAEYSTWSAMHISLTYMSLISFFYFFFPDIFFLPFGIKGDPVSFKAIYNYGVILLRFVAVYSIFDSMNIIFSSAIKGAGDTGFVMRVIVVLSWLILVIPTFLAVNIFNLSLFAAWFFATCYTILLGLVFYWRFKQGKWKSMRVIEPTVIESIIN